MAPVKIKHVVSFTSQDPKYPVENLLLEESLCPWLSCPRDRGRQLKAELQLEQASHIGYVDIGNCGSAFLQIDVGRSSWPLDQNYLTLLPTTTLMTPADAKLDKNRSGVRMFKAGDFLASVLGEKWDRIRLTCTQPFNRHAQFGLAFIRLRTPLDGDCSRAELAPSLSQAPASPDSLRLSRSSFCRAFFPEAPSSTEEEAELKSRLQQLDPASGPGAQSTAWMSRPAKMVLKAACARRRTLPRAAVATPPATEAKKEKGLALPAAGVLWGRSAMGPKQELPGRRGPMRARQSQRRGSRSSVERSVAAPSASPQDASQRASKGHSQSRRLPKTEEGSVVVGLCPICAGRFPTSLLPAHASSCGEDSYEASPSSSSSSASWEPSPEAWVHCPLCQLPFPAVEVEGHASTCGEEVEPSGGSPSWPWVD